MSDARTEAAAEAAGAPVARDGVPAEPSHPQRPETASGPAQPPGEQGGPKGPEPTRFGDWEKGGRCFDF